VSLKRLTFPNDINEQLCEVCAPLIESNIESMDFVVLAIVAHAYKTPTWGKEGKIDRKNEQNQ